MPDLVTRSCPRCGRELNRNVRSADSDTCDYCGEGDSPLRSFVAPTPAQPTSPLDDDNWYPRVWSELADLKRVYGRTRLDVIPVAGLIAKLDEMYLASFVAMRVRAMQCRTLAEVLDQVALPPTDNLILHGLSAIEHHMLMATLTDELRAALRTQSKSAENPTSTDHKAEPVATPQPPTNGTSSHQPSSPARATTILQAATDRAKRAYTPATHHGAIWFRATRGHYFLAARDGRTVKLVWDATTIHLVDALTGSVFWREEMAKVGSLSQQLHYNNARGLMYALGHRRGPGSKSSISWRTFLAKLYHDAGLNRAAFPGVMSGGYEDALIFPDKKSPQPPTTHTPAPQATATAQPTNLGWVELQTYARTLDPAQLQRTQFRAIAHQINSTRARNALLRHTPNSLTLYDLVMQDEVDILHIPNFGPTSLELLAVELRRILDNLQLADPSAADAEKTDTAINANAAAETPPPQFPPLAWYDLHQWLEKHIDPRAYAILQRYHGGLGAPQTLDAIAQDYGLTRERIRQIKAKAGRRLAARFTGEAVARAFQAHATARLEADGHPVTGANLLLCINNPQQWLPDDAWLIDWLNDVYGANWFAHTATPSAEDRNRERQQPLGLSSTISLTEFLKNFAYRPLTVEEALAIASLQEPSLTAYDLRLRLEDTPDVRLFPYGDLQIGHTSWRWFNPTRGRNARRVEWALRLVSTPLTVEELVYTLRARLGILDITAFDVVDACEQEADRFYEEDGRYGLALWQTTWQIRQPLADLLRHGPLLLTDIAAQWPGRYSYPFAPEQVMAALHMNPDRFTQVAPLRWGLVNTQIDTPFDPATLSFEDLFPSL
jgi:hypothetical protein